MEEKASLIEVVVLYVTLGFLILAGFIVYFVVLSRARYNRYFREKKEIEQRFGEAMLQSQIEIQAQTLDAIALEIHDNIAQGLTLAKLNLHTADIPVGTAAGDKVRDSRELIMKAIQDLRDLSRSLHSVKISEKGLRHAIEHQLDMIRKAGGPHGEFRTTGKPIPLDAKVELILFRMIQELLNNVLKHAEAKNILVTADYRGDYALFEIADDGQGFDAAGHEGKAGAKESSGDGVGLLNMRSRATAIGADFRITSKAGEGTRATIRISLP
jgi:signal transduction histidine kinase